MTLKLRDLLEKALLAGFTAWFALRIAFAIADGESSWVSALVLVGEILVLVFVFVRRPATELSTSWREWLVALAASSPPLFVEPSGNQLAPTWIIAVVFLVGAILQLAAKLNLNRSFGLVPANRGIVTTGFYGIVRHPVYATYLIGHIAFLLANWSVWNLCVYAVGWALQIARMLAEEALLMRDPAYVAYRRNVRYRLAPGIF